MNEQIKTNLMMAANFLDKLPEGVTIISVSANDEQAVVQLYGKNFDFRSYAKANGASVEAKRTDSDCIQLRARLFGCDVVRCLIDGYDPRYEQEAALL